MLLCSRRSSGFIGEANYRFLRRNGLVRLSFAGEHRIMRFMRCRKSKLFPWFLACRKKDHKKVKLRLKDRGVRSEEYWEGV